MITPFWKKKKQNSACNQTLWPGRPQTKVYRPVPIGFDCLFLTSYFRSHKQPRNFSWVAALEDLQLILKEIMENQSSRGPRWRPGQIFNHYCTFFKEQLFAALLSNVWWWIEPEHLHNTRAHLLWRHQ